MDVKQSAEMNAVIPKIAIFSQQVAWIKPVIIFIMMLILLIPLAFIRSLVNDREGYQRTAEASIMEPAGGEPVIEGLALAVPYDEVAEYTDSSRKVVQKGKKTDYILTVPETYNLVTQINPYRLSRGIFTVPVFNGELAVTAHSPVFSSSNSISQKKISAIKMRCLSLG